MRHHPIIFGTESVRAILNGRKTQTRRVIKALPPANGYVQPMSDGTWEWSADGGFDHGIVTLMCSYNVLGDRLWVRESWCLGANGPLYKADADGAVQVAFRNPMFMPRQHCRILLEVTRVRAQRLQDISEADAMAEGVERIALSADTLPGVPPPLNRVHPFTSSYVDAYKRLWESINAKRGYPWADNWWVWAISFRRVRP